jgi:hypothetical protein
VPAAHVLAQPRLRTDWTDAAAYAALLEADRSLFAWEWLRRDPLYRARSRRASAEPDGDAADFGLVTFEPAELRVPLARPLWRADACPYVVGVARARAGMPGDAFDVDRMGSIARLVSDGAGEHLLLCDGLRTIRLDAPSGVFTSGTGSLRYRLVGLQSAERPLLTVRRFLALCRRGTFSRSLHPPEVRARRWMLMLRAFDALAAGAGHREIAERLLSPAAAGPRWREREPSLRSRAQRLIRSARRFARGGYRSLLL